MAQRTCICGQRRGSLPHAHDDQILARMAEYELEHVLPRMCHYRGRGKGQRKRRATATNVEHFGGLMAAIV